MRRLLFILAAAAACMAFAAPGALAKRPPFKHIDHFVVLYTTATGPGQISARGGSRVFIKSLPGPPGASRAARTATCGLLRDIARDTPRGDLWLACARPPALLRVRIPELRTKLR
jgi:hypothetical protein